VVDRVAEDGSGLTRIVQGLFHFQTVLCQVVGVVFSITVIPMKFNDVFSATDDCFTIRIGNNSSAFWRATH
jgi:hypothetical protein